MDRFDPNEMRCEQKRYAGPLTDARGSFDMFFMYIACESADFGINVHGAGKWPFWRKLDSAMAIRPIVETS